MGARPRTSFEFILPEGKIQSRDSGKSSADGNSEETSSVDRNRRFRTLNLKDAFHNSSRGYAYSNEKKFENFLRQRAEKISYDIIASLENEITPMLSDLKTEVTKTNDKFKNDINQIVAELNEIDGITDELNVRMENYKDSVSGRDQKFVKLTSRVKRAVEVNGSDLAKDTLEAFEYLKVSIDSRRLTAEETNRLTENLEPYAIAAETPRLVDTTRKKIAHRAGLSQIDAAGELIKNGEKELGEQLLLSASEFGNFAIGAISMIGVVGITQSVTTLFGGVNAVINEAGELTFEKASLTDRVIAGIDLGINAVLAAGTGGSSLLAAGLVSRTIKSRAKKFLEKISDDVAEFTEHVPTESLDEVAESIDNVVESAKNVKPILGNKYVRELPDLSGSLKEAFDGHIFKGTYEPGEILFKPKEQDKHLQETGLVL